MLERLGPVFIKIGQHLALRPDVIPQAYCDEFLLLVDAVPPQPFVDSHRTIAEDLGQDPDTIFRFIDPVAVGAASLAQVYRGITNAGTEVAIKVLRDGIVRQVDRDLRRVRLIARLLGRAATTGVQARTVAEEIARWLHEELDLGRELRNIERMRALPWDPARTRIPRPFPGLSGPRVLVMEFLHGVAFTETLRLVRIGRIDRLDTLGVAPDILAENLLETMLQQVFRNQLFHADTHPGNLIALPGDKVGFVDFGLVDTLDESMRDNLVRYLRAVYLGDAEAMLDGLLELLIAGENADVVAFRTAFIERTHRWRAGRQVPDGEPAESENGGSPIARYLVDVLALARRSGLQLPSSMLSIYRSLVAAETIAYELGSEADLASVGRTFFTRLQTDSLRALFDLPNLKTRAIQLAELAVTAPAQVQRLLNDLAEDRFVLQVETTESAAARRNADRRARLIAACILSVGLAVLLYPTRGIVIAGVPVAWPIGFAEIVLYGVIMVLWRRLSS
jgi:ubiquinone biosynthesis protein